MSKLTYFLPVFLFSFSFSFMFSLGTQQERWRRIGWTEVQSFQESLFSRHNFSIISGKDRTSKAFSKKTRNKTYFQLVSDEEKNKMSSFFHCLYFGVYHLWKKIHEKNQFYYFRENKPKTKSVSNLRINNAIICIVITWTLNYVHLPIS